MNQKIEERSHSHRGLRGVIAAAVFGAVLAVTPVQAQEIPQVTFGACGPMDVVFIIDTTGSMQGAIDNIKADISTPGTGIIDTIVNAAGEDGIPAPEARLGVVAVSGASHLTFDGQQYDCAIADQDVPNNGVGDCIIVLRDLGSDIGDVASSIAGLPAAGGGGNLPEITDEALRTVLEGVDQTGDVVGGPSPEATAPALISGDPNDWPRLQWKNWNGAFTAPKKVIFLITDNVPGGTDDTFDAGDSALANSMALAAAAQGVIIQPILVALSDESYAAGAEAIMQNYATVTGGQLTKVPFSGEGTSLAIISIIEACGSDLEEKEGRMTGGGSIFHENKKTNPRVTHGFTLHCDGGPNNLEVNWPGNRFHMESLTEASCYDYPELDEQNPVAGFDTIVGTGVGRLNGVSGATVAFRFVDDGEPGKVSDTASITISNGGTVLEVVGTLQNGNHQAHGEN